MKFSECPQIEDDDMLIVIVNRETFLEKCKEDVSHLEKLPEEIVGAVNFREWKDTRNDIIVEFNFGKMYFAKLKKSDCQEFEYS